MTTDSTFSSSMIHNYKVLFKPEFVNLHLYVVSALINNSIWEKGDGDAVASQN